MNEFAATLDGIVMQKESSLERIRETATAAKTKNAPSTGKEAGDKATKKPTR